jgi:selenocysteine lyase/cysteine desulfurase
MDFHDAIGRERIEARCRELSAYLRHQLQEIPTLQPMTPTDHELSGALQTWALDKGDSSAILNRLRHEYQILFKTAQSTYAYCPEERHLRENYNAIRFSTHIFNYEAQIDYAVDVLRRVLAEA